MEQKKYNTIQSLQTGLTLLEIIAHKRKPLKFTEIQKMTDMTKSNLHKYLMTFTQNGFLYRDEATNTYRLGHKLVEFGALAQEGSSIVELADPLMKDFTKQTHLTALIAEPSDRGPLIKEIWSVTYGIDIGAQNGTNLPLISSTGLVYAAFGKSQKLLRWKERCLESLLEEQRKIVLDEIEIVKRQMFASKKEPIVEHISSCSVPIFDFQKNLICAITVVGYENAVANQPEHPVAKKLIAIAEELSTYYGFSN